MTKMEGTILAQLHGLGSTYSALSDGSAQSASLAVSAAHTKPSQRACPGERRLPSTQEREGFHFKCDRGLKGVGSSRAAALSLQGLALGAL